MKKFLAFLSFSLVTTVAFTQQEIQVSHNMFNHMGINPGYAGANDAICATLIVRQQWLGFKDPDGYKGWPQTNLLSIDGAVHPLHGGLGMTIIQDQLGFEKNLNVKLSYAYRHVVGSTGSIGVGFQIGFLNKKIDFTKFKPIDQGDLLLTGGNKDEGNMVIDFAVGAFYKIENKLYFGLSSSQLREADFTLKTAAPSLVRHYYVEAGYFYPINPSFELAPSILIKSDLASTQFDVNALLKWNNKFWGGLSWRAQDAIVILLGYQKGDLGIGYSYDVTTSAMGGKGRSGGSHEIMVKYCFKIVIPEYHESYKNPRFL